MTMSTYPEHDKLSQVKDQTQAIGEFLDWLGSQGIQLMTWREDLTDDRQTDPQCPERFDSRSPASCDPSRREGEDHWDWVRRHCMHWIEPEHPAAEGSSPGECCRCGKGRRYEVTGLSAWVSDTRSTIQLLADWAGIDLKVIETEKRQMLDEIRAANAKEA